MVGRRTLKPSEAAHGPEPATSQMTALSMLPLPTRLDEVVSHGHGHGFADSAYLVSTYAGRGVSYRHPTVGASAYLARTWLRKVDVRAGEACSDENFDRRAARRMQVRLTKQGKSRNAV